MFPIVLRLVFNNQKLPYNTTCINSTSITQPFVLLFVTKSVEFATFTQTVMITTVLFTPEVLLNIE